MEVPCYGLPQVNSFVYSRQPVSLLPESCDSFDSDDVARLLVETATNVSVTNVVVIYTGQLNMFLLILTVLCFDVKGICI